MKSSSRLYCHKMRLDFFRLLRFSVTKTKQKKFHTLMFSYINPSAEDALADIPDDATLELVWKNNERLKEYVLVSSKELEYEEDPGSLSETARAGHFTLEQCLNLFTKPEVLAPEEAW